jgi:hypothetical protein
MKGPARVDNRDEEVVMKTDEAQHLETKEESFFHKLRRIDEGLKAEKDSGAYKFAVMELKRLIAPSSASTSVCVLVLLLLVLLVGRGAIQYETSLAVQPLPEKTVEQPDLIKDEKPEPIETTAENIAEVPGVRFPDPDAALNDASPSESDKEDHRIPALVAPGALTLSVLGPPSGPGPQGTPGGPPGGKIPQESLTAVLRALRWLKENQREDGSWDGSDSRTGMTGLALLCFTGHGETVSSEEFGNTVEKAIRYLLYVQKPDGRFEDCGPHYVYGHAIATYALAEAYDSMKLVSVKRPLERAVTVIIEGQQSGGAWDYDYNLDPDRRKDLSVGSWQIQALKAAKIALADSPEQVPGLADALVRSIEGVKSFGVGGGALSYDCSVERRSAPLTGAGVLSLQLLGASKDSAVAAGMAVIKDLPCTWEGRSIEDNTYAWYYVSQTKYHHGGQQWAKWDERMLPMLVDNQEEDGHWSHGATYNSSDVYDTTLCCLTLEIYYRLGMHCRETALDPLSSPAYVEEDPIEPIRISDGLEEG